MQQLLAWVEDRTGVVSSVKHFLDEEIPASSGWKQVFGSVALFLFLVQAFTGILLGLNYGATPGEAYDSIRYIMREVTGGALMRGLHHWGASAMVIVVVLHMIQVFLWGAYKKPREVTWMAGVVLLLFTLAFALTGYLLPWDNRAYWGTVVTTQIAAGVPLLGPELLRLMGAENGVGVVTFARFYAAHVLVLPAATLILLVFHIYLVRKHGVAPEPGDELLPKQKFYPKQVFKDTVAIFVVFAIIFTLAIVAKAPLGRLADPSDTTYIPRPEWYFMFLFQLLKYFEGPLEVLATVVLPGGAIAFLFALPFIDPTPIRKVTQRTAAIAGVALSLIAFGGLTAAAIVETPPDAARMEAYGPMEWIDLTPLELAGVGYFEKERCNACHTLGLQDEGKPGPNLGAGGVNRDIPWMIAHFKQPANLVPGSQMPPVTLKASELNALASFLTKLTPQNAVKMSEVPRFATEGAMIYQRFQCGACHQVNGTGGKLGPPLNGLAKRRNAEWVKGHFLDPQKFVPGTTMPAYKFSPQENDDITEYLMRLP
ncbi:cytochrome b N-terminal domain-containing protein [Oscillatoria amoena NRMC-F 0135]|nr:cytochrome b N-terminal domain-containing protein [Oscillatoria amoena NRMC-F 0135]